MRVLYFTFLSLLFLGASAEGDVEAATEDLLAWPTDDRAAIGLDEDYADTTTTTTTTKAAVNAPAEPKASLNQSADRSQPAGARIPAGANIPTAGGGKGPGDRGGKGVGDRGGWETPGLYNTWGGAAAPFDGQNSYGMSCPSIRYRNKCYYLAYSQESWHTARDYCVRIGHTLTRIQSSDEATFLASYLYEGVGKMLYWVDLNDERTEGVWTYSDGSVGYTEWWAVGEPNGNRGENCGLLTIGHDRIGRLVDEPCGEWRRYVCERYSDSACRRAGYRNKCYWFSVQPSTWFNAREYCATMGQRLARVSTTDEANFIARIMPRPSWIDLRYGGQGVGWTYADGSSSAGIGGIFGSIGSGYGYGQQCAELRRYNQKEGRAVGRDCNSLRQFICEYEALPAGSELENPEDIEGSVFGSPMGGPAVGPGGPVDIMNPQMTGGMAGLGPGPGMGVPVGPGPGMGMGGMGYGYGRR